MIDFLLRGRRLFSVLQWRAWQLPCQQHSEASLDPDNLPPGKRETMDFSSGDSPEAKLWKDIWARGQGIGVIGDAPPAAILIERLRREFVDAKQRLSVLAALMFLRRHPIDCFGVGDRMGALTIRVLATWSMCRTPDWRWVTLRTNEACH